MKKHKKLNIISLIVYAICFAWSLLFFWVLAGPTGLLNMLIWQYLLLFAIVPIALVSIHIAIKGINKETLIIPVVLSAFNQLNYSLTWNLLWFSQDRGTEMLFEGFGNAFLICLIPCAIGFLIGGIILLIRKFIKRNKNNSI